MASLFGFTIKSSKKERDEIKNQRSFIEKEFDDGAMNVVGGGVQGSYYDISQGLDSQRDEIALVTRYRQIAQEPECEVAIDEIVNEAISFDQGTKIIDINVDDVKASDAIKKKIAEEFENIVNMIGFNFNAYDMFRQWYVDGRLYYEKKIDTTNPKKGITSFTLIDPRKIKKVREVTKGKGDDGAEIITDISEYFLYNPSGLVSDKSSNQVKSGGADKLLKMSVDSISHVTSGLRSIDNRLVYSFLHKAIKPLNQLKMLEDSVVIYRIARAPERRIFYVDVGNLPKAKAEQYLNQLMSRYKSKLVYDSSTGELKDEKRHMSMLEDYWMPRREGGKGTEVQTLPSGANLGELEDVKYFQKKLYKSLHVPVSRLESDSSFSLGSATEITRDETKFNRFVNRLRNKFVSLFDDFLMTQLVLKGILSRDDWKELRNSIRYEFELDNNFSELKKNEVLKERLSMLGDVNQYVGLYFSKNWVYKNILRLDDLEIEKMKKEMKTEEKDGIGTQDNFEENTKFNLKEEQSSYSNDRLLDMDLDNFLEDEENQI